MNLKMPFVDKKDFFSSFFLVILYVLGFYGLQIFLYRIGIAIRLPNETNICVWDSGYYKSIADNGYTYTNGANNSAFFFLFPLLWHIFNLGVWGACIMNVLLFATGFSLLTAFFKLSMQDKLVWLTIPSLYIVYVPYSEALFFLLATLCIIGIEQQRRVLVWVSIILLSLTRATVLFIVPAFLLMQLLGNDNKKWGKSLLGYLTDYLLPSIAGMGIFVIVQYVKTGVWFAYFIQQSTFWERKFSPPVFPLTGLDGSDRLIWISALALFVCFVALALLTRLFVLWLVKGKVSNKAYVLSAGYLALTLLIIIFYNPTWGTLTTLVIGSARYALVNPFFYVFLYYQTMKANYKWGHYVVVFVVSNLFWLAFGSYKHINYQLFFLTSSIIAMFYMFYANKKLTWPVMIITALNFFFQVMLFQQYLNGMFPDG